MWAQFHDNLQARRVIADLAQKQQKPREKRAPTHARSTAAVGE
jgi:hypothetical protein